MFSDRAIRVAAQRASAPQLQFERLILEFSSAVANLPIQNGDRQLEMALARVLTHLGLDRCSVFEWQRGDHTPKLTYSIAADSSKPPVRRFPANGLPWLARQVRAHATFAMSDLMRDLPAEAVAERAFAQRYGLHCLLLAVTSCDTHVTRGVAYCSTRGSRDWTADVVMRLQVVGQILIGALSRRQAERDLRATEARYREVVESQTDLVCRYLPDTTLTFVNAAYCRFFGRSRSQLIGRRFLDLIPESAHEWARGQVAIAVKDRRSIATEHRVLRPDGSQGWQYWVDSPIMGPDGGVVELQGIGRDITERKAVEEGLQHLAHATRLAVAGELTASIAHEVNQPLGAIRSNADAAEMLLQHDALDMGELRNILADIRSDARRASDVVRRIRGLVRKPDPNLRPLDLGKLATEVVALVACEARRRQIEIRIELTENGLPVRADKVCLQQVLMNLLMNGMDAVAAQSGAPRRLVISSLETAQREVGIAVSDSGPGVAADVLPKLFDSFFTTKSEGMGLGLSLARSLVQAHGGRIWAENNSGGGATFRFLLPAAAPVREQEDAVAEAL